MQNMAVERTYLVLSVLWLLATSSAVCPAARRYEAVEEEAGSKDGGMLVYNGPPPRPMSILEIASCRSAACVGKPFIVV
jgi:hypothetical protein